MKARLGTLVVTTTVASVAGVLFLLTSVNGPIIAAATYFSGILAGVLYARIKLRERPALLAVNLGSQPRPWRQVIKDLSAGTAQAEGDSMPKKPFNAQRVQDKLEAHWRALCEIRSELEAAERSELADRLAKLCRELDDISEEVTEVPE